MSADKKNYASTLLLLILGILVLYTSPLWLVVLIPAAITLWYATGRSRNQTDENRIDTPRIS